MSKSSLAPLISIAQRGTPFTDRAGQACIYFRAWRSSGFDYFPIRSPQFRQWFFAEYYSEHETIPTSHAFHALLQHLEAQANSDPANQRLQLFQRVGTRTPGYFPNEILLDLANPRREFVEITPTGWKTTTGHAFFRTSRSTDSLSAPEFPRSEAPLPTPEPTTPASEPGSTDSVPVPDPPAPEAPPAPESPAPAASTSPASEAALTALRSFLNLDSCADWLRCLAWLLSALRPYGPFPPLILQGSPSSGKTLAARVFRSLIDPCVGVAVREPGTPGSDPLLKSVSRPMLLTVTDRFECPDSLAERALTVTFAPLPKDCRRAEAALATAFGVARPAILAALCDAVSTALRRIPEMTLPTGRSPDALAWAMAAAPALGCTEDEMRDAFNAKPPSDPTVEAVRALVDQQGSFTGRATDLQHVLPASPHFSQPKGLSQHLKKHILSLADAGIAVKFARTRKSRIIDLLPVPMPLPLPVTVGQVVNLQADCESASSDLSDSTRAVTPLPPASPDSPASRSVLPDSVPCDASLPTPLPDASHSVGHALACPPNPLIPNPAETPTLRNGPPQRSQPPRRANPAEGTEGAGHAEDANPPEDANIESLDPLNTQRLGDSALKSAAAPPDSPPPAAPPPSTPGPNSPGASRS